MHATRGTHHPEHACSPKPIPHPSITSSTSKGAAHRTQISSRFGLFEHLVAAAASGYLPAMLPHPSITSSTTFHCPLNQHTTPILNAPLLVVPPLGRLSPACPFQWPQTPPSQLTCLFGHKQHHTSSTYSQRPALLVVLPFGRLSPATSASMASNPTTSRS